MARSDGALFWASGFVQCLRSRDGEIRGYAKLLRDRTDIRGQIETLRNRAESLAKEDERKVLMFGALAHELRTPFSAIGNAVQLVEHVRRGDSSLDFEVVFWMTDPDYNKYMDAQQAINLALVRRFEQEKIGFAYPTRSLFVEAPVRVELAGRA